MEDAYFQTLQFIGKTVEELKESQQELNRTVNERFKTLERKVDVLVRFFTTDTKTGDQREGKIQRLLNRPREFLAEENTPDRGSASSLEIPHYLTNGHLSDEDVTSSSESRPLSDTADITRNQATGDTSQESPTPLNSTTDIYSDSKVTIKAEKNTVEKTPDKITEKEVVDTFDESIKSIQETIVENPVGKRARTENDNFEMSRSRIRPPSPLPWSSERRAVHYSRFKKLKTENSDDNRTKYLANELEIRHDTSNPDDEAREQVITSISQKMRGQVEEFHEESKHQSDENTATTQQKPETEMTSSRQSRSFLPNNRLLSETGLKNEHDDDNRFVREAHLSEDSILNMKRQKGWDRNLEECKQTSSENRTAMKEPERNEIASETITASSEIKDVIEDSNNEDEELSPDITTLMQQILSQQELKAKENEDMKAAEGLDTIICIDTSTSMKGEPLNKGLRMINEFIDGVESVAADYELEENLAIVTFGRENRILQHLTNDYDLVRDVLEKIEAGGPSPLWLGLALSLTEISQRGSIVKLNSRTLATRIILVTDGFATSVENLEGQESTEQNKKADATIKELVRMNLDVLHSISIIIVSDYNEVSLAKIAKMTNGKMILNPSQTVQLYEYFRMQHTLDGIAVRFGDEKTSIESLKAHIRREAHGLSDSSANEILDVLRKEKKIVTEEKNESNRSKEVTAGNPSESGAEKLSFVLKPWSRVQTAQNWTGNPNRHGLLGTVISTRKKGKVKILWDDGVQETVKFGEDGVYEVHVVNKPKLLEKDEEIAVGVFVARGPDWRWKNQDGGEGSVGVVTKIENENVVHVVWADGKLGNYRFGYGGKYDIKVCSDQRKLVHIVWEYRESGGESWNTLPSDFMEEIECLYQTNPVGKSDLKTSDTTYILDLAAKKITDTANAEMPWIIRRREVPDEEWRKMTSAS